MDLAARLRRALAGRYEVQRELGRGGMAVVFLADDLRHHRQVAVKVLRPELAAAIGDERFLQEIAVVARLQHPHILPLHDSGSESGLLYYVMPFVEGESLRARLVRERQIPVPDAVRIASEVADALGYAHGQGVIHRDIKPENILLVGEHALVVDFGIAHATTPPGTRRLTETGIAIGTPEYMSPEQVGPGPLDGRSDLYALGCVLFEMLAGEPPFRAVTPQALMAQHAVAAPPQVSALRPSVPEPVRQALHRVLEKAPADRFATAAEFRAALTGGPAPPPPRPRAARWRLGAALAVVLAASAVAVWRLRPAPTPLEDRRVVVFPLESTELVAAPVDEGWEVALAVGAALEHSEPLKWIDGVMLLPRTAGPAARRPSQESAVALARRARARYYVTGVIRGTGEGRAVTLRLHDALGDSLVAQETSAGGVTLAASALDAVRGLLPSLLAPDRIVDLSPLTERAPGAVALALQGDREYRNSRFGAALDFYRRAVDEDSAFAFAAVKAAQAASWTAELDAADAMIAQALRRDSLLPPKYRAFAIGLAAYLHGASVEASAAFARALALDPEWAEAWMALGEVRYHLSPAMLPANESAPDSLADVAFRAAASDSAFSPPLVHLAEIAARRGDAAGVDALVARFTRFGGDTALTGELRLLQACLRRGPAALADPATGLREAFEAAENLAASSATADCAEAGFGRVLADSAAGAAPKWAALMGLNGLLVVRGRIEAAGRLLDSSLASGFSAANYLVVLDVLAGAPFEARADRAERRIRDRAGEAFERASAEGRWLFGAWLAESGDTGRAAAVARGLRAGDDADPRLAGSLEARLALARGDSAGALARLADLPMTATRQGARYAMSAVMPAERLIYARLLFAAGRLEDAAKAATAFDHPSSLLLLPYLPASLTLRLRIAERLERARQADVLRARLRAWGWSDDVAVP